jgi:predicted kinase
MSLWLTREVMFVILVVGVRQVRKLVVLVGPAGSGKTTFCCSHPEWAVVSKDDIRRNVFHCDFDLSFEDAIEGIFAATLVEAVQSPAEVVCVDKTNLTKAERQVLIEVARDSGRESIAYVMASRPQEDLYERKLLQLSELASTNNGLVAGGFSEDRYKRTYEGYEEVADDEGFVKVFRDVELGKRANKRKMRSSRKKDKVIFGRLDALPLFNQMR